jgi:hypothetical protein
MIFKGIIPLLIPLYTSYLSKTNPRNGLISNGIDVIGSRFQEESRVFKQSCTLIDFGSSVKLNLTVNVI